MFNAATLAEVRKAERRARAQLRDRKSQPPRDLAPAIAAVETSAAAFAFGCAHGESGAAGMADLWTGAAFHAVTLFTGDAWFAPHAHALGDGALAACAYRHGLAAVTRATPRPSTPPPANPAVRAPTSVTFDLTVARLTITARR
jgi:hypothetical protein